MPKSRNRGRGQPRPQPKPRTFWHRWGKWLTAIPLVALLVATFLGVFGGTAAAVPLNGSSSSAPVQSTGR